MIDEIEKDIAKQLVKTSLKTNINVFKHIIKCDKCMDKYAEIIICVSSDQRIRRGRKFKDIKTVYDLHNMTKEKKK